MWYHISAALWLIFYVSAELDQEIGIMQLLFSSVSYAGIVFSLYLQFSDAQGKGCFSPDECDVAVHKVTLPAPWCL